MFDDSFRQVPAHEGVGSITTTTWSAQSVHGCNTWNSCLQLTDDNAILLPAAWMNRTERNIRESSSVIRTPGSRAGSAALSWRERRRFSHPATGSKG